MSDLHFHVEFKAPRFLLQCFLLPCLELLAVTELGSENVTLTTYYPAPSGVYTQIIATQNAYLARDGGRVGIGTATPTAKLHVMGDARIRGDLNLEQKLKLGNLAADPVGSPGSMYYNNATDQFRGYYASGWKDLNTAATLPSLCYCLWCREGDKHPSGGGWKCSANGGAAGPSDDKNAPQGCMVKMKLVPQGMPCSWP